MPFDCTARKNAVKLDLDGGEHLWFEIGVKGSQGRFTFADENDNVIFSDGDWPPHQSEYERKWPQDPSERPPGPDVSYAMGFVFVQAQEYAYKVEHREAGGGVIRVLKDCTVTGDPDDSEFDPIRVGS